MGAFSFQGSHQSVASNRLDLGTCFGFQEVFYKDGMRIREMTFAFRLEPRANLAFFFTGPDTQQSGILFSAGAFLASAPFTASNDGRFMERRALAALGTTADQWHDVKLSATETEFGMALDGEPVGRTPVIPIRLALALGLA